MGQNHYNWQSDLLHIEHSGENIKIIGTTTAKKKLNSATFDLHSTARRLTMDNFSVNLSVLSPLQGQKNMSLG